LASGKHIASSKLLRVFRDKLCRAASEHAIIHMDDENKGMLFDFVVKNGQICMGDIETKVNKCMAKCIVPFLPCLLKLIK
jgi:hypothetical protein